MTTAALTEPYNEDFKGLRVPWVAQWSGERLNLPITPTTSGFTYMGQVIEDRTLGVLWMATNTKRGGEPIFSQVNTIRQRDAMILGICQVCGMDAEGWWLIPPAELAVTKINGRPFITQTPPTCRSCIDVARQLCPHIRTGKASHGPIGFSALPGGQAIQVQHWRPFSVWADVLDVTRTPPKHFQAEVKLDHPKLLPWTAARQLMVEVYDYRRVSV